MAVEKDREIELSSVRTQYYINGEKNCKVHQSSGEDDSNNSAQEEGKTRWGGIGLSARRLISQTVNRARGEIVLVHHNNHHHNHQTTESAQASLPIEEQESQQEKEETEIEPNQPQDQLLQQKQLEQPTNMTIQPNALPNPPSSVHPIEENNPNNTDNGAAGKPIPQAVLVYHESAHSIVFRDHLRRQQGAIRRTSSLMENSTHGGTESSNSGTTLRRQYSQPIESISSSSAHNNNNHAAPLRTATSTILEGTEESDLGYESGGSRGSRGSRGSSASRSSATSGGSGSKILRRAKSGLTTRKEKMAQTKATPSASSLSNMQPVIIANFCPVIEPLESLDLNSSNVFEPLLHADPFNGTLEMTPAEKDVVELLKNEQAAMKTVRNAEWTAFLEKFKPSGEDGKGVHEHHPAYYRMQNKGETKTSDIEFLFNSFVTSTSLLPSGAKKMRCFGSTNEYAVGVVFGLPTAHPNDDSEDEAISRTKTWSWPSGYSAKTEFNIDHHGNLINGREEALVPLSGLRKMNHAYLHDEDYIVGGRMVKGGLTTIPYNEVYLRVGGHGRIVENVCTTTGRRCHDADGSGRSYDHGTGLPIALFVRENDFGHLVRLLRTRARYSAIFGSEGAKGIPLLYITPENGVRVFTEKLQHQVMKVMAWDLNPFQNSSLAHKTGIDNTSEPHLQQKLEELLDLDDDELQQVLTPEEMARIAGGFGATDESVAHLLHKAVQRDRSSEQDNEGHNLQELVNEGLAFALRANDYHTSRQLLILYTLVASRSSSNSMDNPLLEKSDRSETSASGRNWREAEKKHIERESEHDDGRVLPRDERALGTHYVPPPPPPPPLDTDRLRSATNSDGLLAVLGAAQVLRAMRDGSAKRRVKESIDSIEE